MGNKLPRLLLHLKYRSVVSSSYGATVPLCIGEQEFKGFLDLREKIFFLSRNTGGCLAIADRVLKVERFHMLIQYIFFNGKWCHDRAWNIFEPGQTAPGLGNVTEWQGLL
jgi:hypothetical protein